MFNVDNKAVGIRQYENWMWQIDEQETCITVLFVKFYKRRFVVTNFERESPRTTLCIELSNENDSKY